MPLNMQEVAPEVKDRISVVKIDTEKYPQLAARYNVQGLPTMCVFKDGKVVQRLEGFLTRPQLLQSIGAYL
jgi:thioredoxin-like negative regulator of GroEL